MTTTERQWGVRWDDGSVENLDADERHARRIARQYGDGLAVVVSREVTFGDWAPAVEEAS